jgi:hypothetical protein
MSGAVARGGSPAPSCPNDPVSMRLWALLAAGDAELLHLLIG